MIDETRREIGARRFFSTKTVRDHKFLSPTHGNGRKIGIHIRESRDVEKLETVGLRRRFFFTIARDSREYQHDIVPSHELLTRLRERGADIFTFIERRWCFTHPKPPDAWRREKDNVALIRVTSYEDWWNEAGKKTKRRMVRRAKKFGVSTRIAEPSEDLAKGIWKIYNETPIRQDRGFPGYGVTLETVRRQVLGSKDSSYIGAYYSGDLIGFVHLVYGDNIAIMSDVLSLMQHWKKAPNNALVAKAVEVCADKGIPYLMYGRIGNHPSLDMFKQSNGFFRFPLTRYYIPLTRRGMLAIRLRVHQEIKDVLPPSIKYPLIPLANWVDRTKTKTLLFLNRII